MKSYGKKILKQYKNKNQYQLFLFQSQKMVNVPKNEKIEQTYSSLEILLKQQEALEGKADRIKDFMEVCLKIDSTEKLLRQEMKLSLQNETDAIAISN